MNETYERLVQGLSMLGFYHPNEGVIFERQQAIQVIERNLQDLSPTDLQVLVRISSTMTLETDARARIQAKINLVDLNYTAVDCA